MGQTRLSRRLIHHRDRFRRAQYPIRFRQNRRGHLMTHRLIRSHPTRRDQCLIRRPVPYQSRLQILCRRQNHHFLTHRRMCRPSSLLKAPVKCRSFYFGEYAARIKVGFVFLFYALSSSEKTHRKHKLIGTVLSG